MKIMLAGDVDVGKTCLTYYMASNAFRPSSQLTSIETSITITEHYRRIPANITVWDTAGQERHCSITVKHCRGGACGVPLL